MRLSGFLTRRSALILVLLLIVAAALSVASYEYSSQVSANIASLSVDQIHSNTQIEASDLSHLLQKSLDAVSTNLNLLASSHAVIAQNTSAAILPFSATQNSTQSLTTDYYWINQTGSIILVSNGTSATLYPSGTGTNLSDRSSFLYPKDNGTTFFSSATQSISNSSIDYIFISRPVYGPTKTFNGVVAAAIDLRTLGRSLESDLSPSFHSQLGLLDFKGTILYSANESLIGQSVFGSAFQNILPPSLKPKFNTFLNQSLNGQAGYQDITYQGTTATLAYQPIFVNATTSSGGQVPVQFGVLYITASDTLASSASALIGQERSVSLMIILGIAAVSAGLAVTTLRWNKRLDDAVREKTSDLLVANRELDRKSQAEKDLMNITAHELRTPTQSILANTEILRRIIRPAIGLQSPLSSDQSKIDTLAGDIQPEEIVDLVDSSHRNAQRLQRLTQNILEVARIDNKTFRLEKENFDLNELVKQSVRDTQAFLSRDNSNHSNLTIVFRQKQPELLVDADRTKVGEVVSNILDNAVKFSNEGGKIEITTDKNDHDERFALVIVKDEGTGVDPELLPKLFTKFATKTGTGLGLYISKSYVEAHGGTLRVENIKDKGKTGARFSFTIPLVSSMPSASVSNKLNVATT